MADKEKITNNKLVMLNNLEQKVARILWPGIDVQEPWTPDGQALVQQSVEKLKEIFNISEEPVSEELEEAALKYSKNYPEWPPAWHCFVEGANWQKEQFEKNRLSACDAQTEEEAQREMEFVMSIIKNEHRQPTFSDAIEYGMRVQKQQMTIKAEALFYHHMNDIGDVEFCDIKGFLEDFRKAMED